VVKRIITKRIFKRGRYLCECYETVRGTNIQEAFPKESGLICLPGSEWYLKANMLRDSSCNEKIRKGNSAKKLPITADHGSENHSIIILSITIIATPND